MASKRITLLAKLATKARRLCDIGCDHGYTLLMAFKLNNNLTHGYALDVNNEPLNQARNTFKDSEYMNKVSFHLSNGLLDFNENFDTAIISGMGGSLISQILEDSKDKFKGKTLILEPQGNINLVRRWLYCNQYDIVDEYDMLENNKYYNFIVAKPATNEVKYNILDINYGKVLRAKRSKEFIDYYTKIYNNFTNINNKPTNISEKLIELEYILNNKDINNNGLITELKVNDNNEYVVIFPGGAYKFTSEREGEIVGLHFNACGYNALVVNYLVDNDKVTEIYHKVSNTLNEYFNDKPRANVHLLGFSAGGHMVLELANHRDIYKLNVKDIMLGYPLVSTNDSITHKESMEFFSEVDKRRYSEELEVNKSSVPMFIFTTLNDEVVNIENTFILCNAYSKLDISYECHILGKGKHGLSLATKESARIPDDINLSVSRWFELANNWLKRKEN